MTLYRRCPEAIQCRTDDYEGWACPHDDHEQGMVRVVWECEKCGGTGEKVVRYVTIDRGPEPVTETCPGCGGSGWQTEEPARVGYGPDAKPEAWVPLGGG